MGKAAYSGGRMSARPAPIFTTGWLESRVVLAEDDILLREGLASLLEQQALFAVLDIAIIVVVVREYRLWCRERTGVNPAH
jgi:hypothetical protein